MENHEGPSKSKPLHAAMLGLALFTGGLIAYAILYRFPEAIVSPEGLRPSAYENAITQERRTLLAILGSIGAAVGLVYTHLRHQLDRDANATGRYTEAVQQLGNESMSIRLGGIYALTRVARDSPGDSKTVTEVLAAFVRDGAQESTGGVALDVMAALTELGRISERSDESRYERVDLRSSRLVGGNLDSVRFPDRVDLRNSFLTGTNLRGASMSGADLTGATLDNAYLGQADLSGTDFSGSSVSQASFERATMRVCLLSELDLQGCNFEKSVLIGSDLSGSSLQRANLRGADLEGADLRNADLTDAVLVDAYVGGALFFGTGLTRETLRALGARDADEAVEEDPDVDERAMKKHEEWRRRNLRHDEMYPWEH